jgi:hypothetical protein
MDSIRQGFADAVLLAEAHAANRWYRCQQRSRSFPLFFAVRNSRKIKYPRGDGELTFWKKAKLIFQNAFSLTQNTLWDYNKVHYAKEDYSHEHDFCLLRPYGRCIGLIRGENGSHFSGFPLVKMPVCRCSVHASHLPLSAAPSPHLCYSTFLVKRSDYARFCFWS